MKIPKEIIQAGQFTQSEIVNIRYLGKYKGCDVYHYAIPDSATGFPFVYLFDGKKVVEVTEFEALEITSLFVKD